MNIHKLKIIIFCIILAAAGSLYIAGRSAEADATQKDIAKEIIRFHVIANSDSDEDQALKIKVKNAVVKELQEKLKNAGTIDDAREIMIGQLEGIEETASAVMREEGCRYGAKASLVQRTFPVKIYGDMAFPAGEYEALQIKLGKAEGKNWWCVMFPTLCFVDGTYSIVPEESKEKLEHVLTEEEYQSLLIKNTGKITIKWKWKEWLKQLFD